MLSFLFTRKNFLKISNDRLVEYKYRNQRTLRVITGVFGEVEG